MESGYWANIWNEQDVQIMVLISLMLQLFLLFAGNVRRRRKVGWLSFLVWLSYLLSYAVVVSAIGLFSQYEDKYKLRSLESFEHLHVLTLPFLWAPFLLLHLGGPDTITALSIEDNNLWTRQFINFLVQLTLVLYVFWKSIDLLDWQLLVVAIPLFISGIIKYGERIWALQKGSRDSLDCSMKEYSSSLPGGDVGSHALNSASTSAQPGDVMESRALNAALAGRGLLAGRTMYHLGSWARHEPLYPFAETETTQDKLKFVLTELGMIYDMLYTKSMVLHIWTGIMVRCVALVAMVVAFVFFWVNQHPHADETTNVVITYTVFVAAIFVEVYSIFMVVASPWTRARSKVFFWISHKLAYCFPSQGLSTPSMGQFNLADYSLSMKSTPKFISKVSEALILEKHWRNFWHIKKIEDKVIVNYIVGLFDASTNSSVERSQQLELGDGLMSLLTQPFEHVLLHLHIVTEMHLSTLDGGNNNSLEGGGNDKMKSLVAECTKLSNYLMYLMVVYPSLLPVSSGARDVVPQLSKWVREDCGNLTKAEMLQKYANEAIPTYPFREPPPPVVSLEVKDVWAMESLKEIKEVWARLLIYAAGKCPMEEHARQLGNEGVELLTVVGSVMMHHRLGVAGWKKVRLLARENFISARSEGSYVFEFLHNAHNIPTSVKPLSLLIEQRESTRDMAQPSTSTQSRNDVVLEIGPGHQ